MNTLGFGVRDLVALTREQGRERPARGPLLVTGLLAEQLARELAAGGDRGMVTTEGDPARAAAVVRVVGGQATPDDERVLREATRALVPVVAVQTGDATARLPYVLAADVVDCPAGAGFPVERIVTRLAVALGSDAAPLAASLPVLRDAVRRHRSIDGALTAASLAALGAAAGPRLPVLALAQARMISDLALAGGAGGGAQPADPARRVAASLGPAVGVGLVARTLVRRLPFRNRAVDGLVAAGATLALGALAGRGRRS